MKKPTWSEEHQSFEAGELCMVQPEGAQLPYELLQLSGLRYDARCTQGAVFIIVLDAVPVGGGRGRVSAKDVRRGQTLADEGN